MRRCCAERGVGCVGGREERVGQRWAWKVGETRGGASSSRLTAGPARHPAYEILSASRVRSRHTPRRRFLAFAAPKSVPGPKINDEVAPASPRLALSSAQANLSPVICPIWSRTGSRSDTDFTTPAKYGRHRRGTAAATATNIHHETQKKRPSCDG